MKSSTFEPGHTFFVLTTHELTQKTRKKAIILWFGLTYLQIHRMAFFITELKNTSVTK